MTGDSLTYRPARTVAEAAELLGKWDDAVLVAGGTTVTPRLRPASGGTTRPGHLVSIAEIPGLDRMTRDGATLRIGALATHETIRRSSMVRLAAPLLSEACASIAHPAIRAMGTVGGCLYQGSGGLDVPAALLALDATVRIEGSRGTRVLPVRRFLARSAASPVPDRDVLVEISIPVPPERHRCGYRQRYVRWSMRAAARPLLCLAVTVRFEDGACAGASLAVSGAAGRPVWLAEASAACAGSRLDRAAVAAAAHAAAAEIPDPLDDEHASGWYRRQVLMALVEETLTGLAGEGAR